MSGSELSFSNVNILETSVLMHVENRDAIFGRMNIDKLRIHNVHTYFIRNAFFFEKTRSTLIVTINAGYKPLFLPKLVNILLLFKFLSASTFASSILNLLDHVMRLDLDWSSG